LRGFNPRAVTLTTRLDTYENVLVETIQTPDAYKTKHGRRMLVTFQQIFMAVVEQTSSRVITTVPVSARPQTSFAMAVGQLQTTEPSQAIVSQRNIVSAVPGQIPPAITAAKVPGATLWSSLNISTLKSLVK